MKLIRLSFSEGLISKAYQAAVETQSNAGAKHLLTKILKEDTVRALQSGKKNLADYDIPGANMDAFIKRLKELNEDIFEIHRMFGKSLPGFQVGQNGVLLVSLATKQKGFISFCNEKSLDKKS